MWIAKSLLITIIVQCSFVEFKSVLQTLHVFKRRNKTMIVKYSIHFVTFISPKPGEYCYFNRKPKINTWLEDQILPVFNELNHICLL